MGSDDQEFDRCLTGDPNQELAKRVADNFFQHGDFPHYNAFLPQLRALIVDELRAGGWKPEDNGKRAVWAGEVTE